jgi:hypothetical protein
VKLGEVIYATVSNIVQIADFAVHPRPLADHPSFLRTIAELVVFGSNWLDRQNPVELGLAFTRVCAAVGFIVAPRIAPSYHFPLTVAESMGPCANRGADHDDGR